MACKICNGEQTHLFVKKVLRKYDVGYYQCKNCNFIQTDEPFWLPEAYESAINHEDIGTSSRSVICTESLTALFSLCGFDRNKKYLDYGAGYGLLVRMMRDNGVNFYWYDEYCKNIFASKFSLSDLRKGDHNFEVVTAFEVFEHLQDPLSEIEKMLALSDSILFSTNLVNLARTPIEKWWYVSPHHGQHIAFYDIKTLKFLAAKYNLNLYSYKNMHFLTKKKISKLLFTYSCIYRAARLYNTIRPPKSLIASDVEFYLKDYSSPD
jgi:2-polyprenyl-3-methyl-5-hydroxy-6-metoxy-1,4-benzoquinol methylase